MALEPKSSVPGRRRNPALIATETLVLPDPSPVDAAAQPQIAEPMAPPAAARRSPRPDLREARQKLVQGRASKPDFDYELLAMFARNERQALITIPTLAVISVFALMFWAPNQLGALGWCAMVIATKFFMTEYCRQFLHQPRGEVNVVDWRRRMILVELVSGMSWGGMALIAATTSDDAAHVFVLAALIVLLAIRMTFASSVMSIFYAGTIPMTVAVFARLMLQGELFHYAMAFMAVGLQVYFVVLAKDLNATSLKLFASRAETEGLIAELEEQKAIADEARRRAESANVAKSRFLATMSHELRTPLNAVIGFSEIMLSEMFGPVGNSRYRGYVRSIYESGGHLLSLINDVLDISKLEAGKYALEESWVNIADAIANCCALTDSSAEAGELRFDRQIADDLPEMYCDERAVRQVLLNLLSNAVKFTPPGGRVALTAQRDAEGSLRIAISDTGIGIPAEALPRIAQPFHQVDNSISRRFGGTGLGLAITRNLMELHGGRLLIESAEGRGATVTAVFPSHRFDKSVGTAAA